MAPGTGACEVRCHVLPPSAERAKLATIAAAAKSPPPTTPCRLSRKATVNNPAVPVPCDWSQVGGPSFPAVVAREDPRVRSDDPGPRFTLRSDAGAAGRERAFVLLCRT